MHISFCRIYSVGFYLLYLIDWCLAIPKETVQNK